MRRTILRAAGLLAAAGVLAGCTTHPAPPISDADLQRARDFHLFTFYWAGRSIAGLPLTAADSTRDYDPTVGMRAYYGNCVKPSSILSSKGCELPLEIATIVYKPHTDIGFGARHQIVVRGVPAEVYNSGASMEIYTGNLAIDIYAQSPAVAAAAADALEPLNRPAPLGHDLAPPRYVPGVGVHGGASTAARPSRRA
jgi:hypothetical protein